MMVRYASHARGKYPIALFCVLSNVLIFAHHCLDNRMHSRISLVNIHITTSLPQMALMNTIYSDKYSRIFENACEKCEYQDIY